MKKLLLVLIVALLAVVAITNVVVAVNGHYDRKIKNQPTPTVVIPKAESDKRIEEISNAAARNYKALVDQFNLQTTECEKGRVAYEKLSAYTKTQVQAPTCAGALTD